MNENIELSQHLEQMRQVLSDTFNRMKEYRREANELKEENKRLKDAIKILIDRNGG